MLSFFSWYLATSFLGLLTFPLAYRLFPALADRGYSLSRALGLLLWGYIFWLLASLGIAPNNLSGLILALLILAGLSGWALWKTIVNRQSSIGNRKSSILDWLRSNLRTIFILEFLFLLAFAVWAAVRAANPEISATEKTMELAFINAILRSPTFPPRDPWLSGYAISYYYFGYVMTAMLAKLTGVLGSVAFNLMLALLFALSAVGAYGLLYNLLASRRTSQAARHTPLGLPLLGPLFLLLVSNLEGFLEVLHQRGIFWPSAQPSTFNFWTWLDIKDLSLPPAQPLGWIPDRYLWWWRASRVLQDYDLAGVWREIIDEFPFFSYLLGDLHPHVLAMPFDLLAIAAALNLFLGGWRGETNLLGLRLPSRTGVLAARLHLRKCRRTVSISRSGFFVTAIILGGLAFLNTWDILAYTALVLGAYVLARVHERGWSWERLEDLFALGLPLGVLVLLLYLPFYVSFSSQAGGILPNLIYPTRGAHLWVMFGALLLPILALLFYFWRGEKNSTNWRLGIGLAFGLFIFLWLIAWAGGLIAYFTAPTLVAALGAPDIATFFREATLRRFLYAGGWLTLLAWLAFALALLGSRVKVEKLGSDSTNLQPSTFKPSDFILLLILLGALLVLAPEFVYLRDQFGWRMNTIFKFYYQAWSLWSLAAAFGAALMLTNLRRLWNWLYSIGLVLLLFAALTYPTLSLLTKTNDFHPPFGWTLDGAAHLDREYSQDADAIRWLQTAPYGVIVEATTPTASYSDYAHISTYTGLPTVLGWPMHEGQWRGGYDEQGTRMDDIQRLYETNDWNTAQAILSQYQVRYVYVGTLERVAYRLNETKFQRFLHPVYQKGNVTIYEVP